MKKLISSLLLSTSIVGTMLGMSVGAAETGTSYGKVPATDTKITIDGKKDAIYDKGLTVKITVPDTANKSTSGTTGEAKVLWNGTDTLYVYVEVKDKEVIKYEGTPNAWETDSVELFLDYSNTVARTRDQYRIDIKNSATYYDTKTYTGDDTKAFGFEAWNVSDTADGYAVEFQLKAYKETIAADMKVGFHLMINDMVAEGRNMFHSDACMNTPAKFGYLTLSADKVTADAVKTDSTTAASASTSDMSLIVSVAALITAAGAITYFKKRK